jgi:hypothetical protein
MFCVLGRERQWNPTSIVTSDRGKALLVVLISSSNNGKQPPRSYYVWRERLLHCLSSEILANSSLVSVLSCCLVTCLCGLLLRDTFHSLSSKRDGVFVIVLGYFVPSTSTNYFTAYPFSHSEHGPTFLGRLCASNHCYNASRNIDLCSYFWISSFKGKDHWVILSIKELSLLSL